MHAFSRLQSKLHEIILSDRLYVDKSRQFIDFIKYLDTAPRLHSANIFMIVRPRGFALTLGTEAIKSILERDELIIDRIKKQNLDQDFPYGTVVRLSLNKINAKTPKEFSDALIELIQYQMWEHHIDTSILTYHNPKSCFLNLIKSLAQKTKEEIVVIVDNYDAPFFIASTLEKHYQDEALSIYLDTLNAIKQAGDIVKWCLLSGHVKFALANEISEGLPIVKDLSYNPICDSIFGFTQEDLEENFTPLVQKFAPQQGITVKEFFNAMTVCYGGYIFSDRKKKLFCPGSINSLFLNEGKFFPYMISGDFNFLKQSIKKAGPDLDWLINKDGQDPLFLEEVSLAPKDKEFGPLLYQLGFITIDKVTRTDHDAAINWRYRFKFTNLENYRIFKVLVGAADQELLDQMINPIVFAQDEHRFDRTNEQYCELFNEPCIF